MRRPFTVMPRGPRRPPRLQPELILGCPRIAPDWELGALAALMKPQRKGEILHREPKQRWPRDAAARVEAARQFVAERIGFSPPIDFPAGGDYLMFAKISREDLPKAMALATLLGDALPGVWIELGRLFLLDGQFYRRERGKKFKLVPAVSIHLRRDLRDALRPNAAARIGQANSPAFSPVDKRVLRSAEL